MPPVPPLPDQRTAPAAWFRPPIRWGIGDFFVVFFVGIVVATFVGAATISIAGWDAGDLTDPEKLLLNGVSGIGQFAGFAAIAALVLRLKGHGVVRDLGLFADRNLGMIALSLVAGFASSIGFGILVLPISHLADGERQELVDQIDNGSGVGLLLLVLTAGVLAPLLEEILFRGLLLRSLLRRMPAGAALLVSAAVFGGVHLIDPKSFPALPALIGVGLVCGWLAIRTGGLARPIAFHMGFNLFTVIVSIAS